MNTLPDLYSVPNVDAKYKLLFRLLEVEVVDQCNLSCKGCANMSPVAKSFVVDTNQLRETLDKLSTGVKSEVVSLFGGEPLLVPVGKLEEIVDIVNSSGITYRVGMITNGVLLSEKHRPLLSKLDQINISLHTKLDLDKVKRIVGDRCKLKITDYPTFRHSNALKGTEDTALIKDIFDNCRVKNEWHCYNIRGSKFYQCSQIHRISRGNPDVIDEGVDIIGSQNLVEDILKHINRKHPFSACKYCLGVLGKEFNCEQISRKKFNDFINFKSEQLIDKTQIKGR